MADSSSTNNDAVRNFPGFFITGSGNEVRVRFVVSHNAHHAVKTITTEAQEYLPTNSFGTFRLAAEPHEHCAEIEHGMLCGKKVTIPIPPRTLVSISDGTVICNEIPRLTIFSEDFEQDVIAFLRSLECDVVQYEEDALVEAYLQMHDECDDWRQAEVPPAYRSFAEKIIAHIVNALQCVRKGLPLPMDCEYSQVEHDFGVLRSQCLEFLSGPERRTYHCADGTPSPS